MCIYIYTYICIYVSLKKIIIDVDSLKIIQSHLPMGLWSDHPTARTFQKSEAEILNSDRGLDRQGSLFWSLPSTQKQWASHPCRERAACSKHLFSKVSTKFCQLDWIQTKSRLKKKTKKQHGSKFLKFSLHALGENTSSTSFTLMLPKVTTNLSVAWAVRISGRPSDLGLSL